MRPEIIVGHKKHVVSKEQHRRAFSNSLSLLSMFACVCAAGEVGAWAGDDGPLAKAC
jgi:hypothetical protein